MTVVGQSLHGKGAVVYLQGAGGAAVPLTQAAEYSLDGEFDNVDDSVLGDQWKTSLKGQQAWKGALSGNFDPTDRTPWDAYNATTPRSFYLYPSSADMTKYYFGTCWVGLPTVLGGSTTKKIDLAMALTGVGALSVNP